MFSKRPFRPTPAGLRSCARSVGFMEACIVFSVVEGLQRLHLVSTVPHPSPGHSLIALGIALTFFAIVEHYERRHRQGLENKHEGEKP